MDRETISKDKLIQLINIEIGKIPEISDCEVSGIYLLREQDENGCNWSPAYYKNGQLPAEKSAPLVGRVISDLQNMYNIEQQNVEYTLKQVHSSRDQMRPERRLLHIGFTVDTNCVNAKQRMPEMNQLEQWAEEELILLLTAETAQEEMAFGNNSERKKRAYSFIFTMSEIITEEERERIQLIGQTIFPGGLKNQNQENDVDIVFNAGKYPNPLITNDGASKSQPGGILGNRKALLDLFGIEVLTPGEAVNKVKRAIQERDSYAREWSLKYNQPLPTWVGQD